MDSLDQEILLAKAKECGGHQITKLNSSGLIHDHFIITGTGLIIRVPRKNELGLTSVQFLIDQKDKYQAAEHTEITPKFHSLIMPTKGLPNGAIVIQYIQSRRPQSHQDLDLVIKALAKMNTTTTDKLQKAQRPFGSQWFVIDQVFGHVFQSQLLSEEIRTILNKQKQSIGKTLDSLLDKDCPAAIIGGDSHIGNFIISISGQAYFVDLQFLTVDVPHLDAADAASPLTSRLDPQNKIKLTQKEQTYFYQQWGEQTGYIKQDNFWDLIKLAERLVTLRTLIWLAYWVTEARSTSTAPPSTQANFNLLADQCLNVNYLKRHYGFL